MKRMLFVSMFHNVASLLRTVEPNLKGKTVTYIPTASRVEKLGFFVKLEKWELKRLGLTVDELEISASSYETIARKLQRNDFIYITGGNTSSKASINQYWNFSRTTQSNGEKRPYSR